MAPSALAKAAIEDHYFGLLRIFAGEPLELRMILNSSAPAPVPAAPAADVPSANPESRPVWIAAERWAALPAMLRAALAGSELSDGAVQCRSPHLSRVLQTRFAREVGELIAKQ